MFGDNDIYYIWLRALKMLSVNFLLPIWNHIGMEMPLETQKKLLPVIRKYYTFLDKNLDNSVRNRYKAASTMRLMRDELERLMGNAIAEQVIGWIQEKSAGYENDTYEWVFYLERKGFIYPYLEDYMFIENDLSWERNRYCQLVEIVYNNLTYPVDFLEQKTDFIEENFSKITPQPDEWSEKIIEDEKYAHGDLAPFLTGVHFYGAYHHFIVCWYHIEQTFTDDEIKSILFLLQKTIEHELRFLDKSVKVPPQILIANFPRIRSLYSQKR